MIQQYILPDYQKDNFYERVMKQRVRDLNTSSTTDGYDSLPIPREPLQSTSSKDQRKRIDTHSSDSGINPPLALFRSPALSTAAPIEVPTPHPSTSLQPQAAQPSPKGPCSPI